MTLKFKRNTQGNEQHENWGGAGLDVGRNGKAHSDRAPSHGEERRGHSWVRWQYVEGFVVRKQVDQTCRRTQQGSAEESRGDPVLEKGKDCGPRY